MRGSQDQIPAQPTAIIAPPTVVEAAEEEAEDLKLTNSDVYQLARKLSEVDEQTVRASGMRLTPQDREEAQSIVGRLANTPKTSSGDSQATASLFKKLVAFVGGKTEVFDANLGNEDAFYLLTIVSDLESEDQVKTFLGLPQEAEKK